MVEALRTVSPGALLLEKSNTDVKSGDRNECCAVGTGGGNETVSKTDMEKKR